MDEDEIAPEEMADFVKGPYVQNADGTIDCTLRHPTLGDIPFTANQNDPEDYGRAAYAYALTQLPS